MSWASAPVALWVRTEPCTFGALPVPPHTRLSVHNIKKMVGYAKSKGKTGYPKLSYKVWRHIAQHKLQLPSTYAWMYWSAYHTIADEMSPSDKLHMDHMLAGCTSQVEIDSVREQTSVRLLKFVLFLHLQHLNKTSLRTSLISVSDEWPMHSRSPDLDGGRSMASTNKSLDEHAHLTFVLHNLSDILDLLAESDPESTKKDDQPQLTLEGAEALSLLIDGSADKLRTIRPVHDLLQTHFVGHGSSASKVQVDASRSKGGGGVKVVLSRSYPLPTVFSWLRNSLSHNPFGIISCMSNGRRLSWPLAGEERENRTEKKGGRIATNSVVIPKDSLKGNKLIIMSQICKQTVARMSNTLEASSLKIHRCHQAYLYLLSPLRSVSIEKCRKTVIVLGPVETTVHLNHCQDCTIIAVTRRLTVSSSTQCTLHLMTPNPPLILNGNQGLILAPYHTHYPQLDAHMAKVGLGPRPNYWEEPQYPGNDTSERPTAHKILPPDDCLPFSVPFEMDGQTRTIPGGLPLIYQQAYERRERLVQSWQEHVKQAGLSKEQKKQFKTLVEEQFQEWLKKSGNSRQLDTLSLGAKQHGH